MASSVSMAETDGKVQHNNFTMSDPYLDIDAKTWPPKIKQIVDKMHRKMNAGEEMKMIDKAWHQTKQIIIH